MKLKEIAFGYTWVGLLNQVLLQWFFIRLQVTVKDKNDMTINGWGVIGFMLPLTGWWAWAPKYKWVIKIFKP